MNSVMNFMSMDQIQEVAPLVLAEQPTRQVSSQYVFANTKTVVEDLAELGWMPTQAGQRKMKKSMAQPSIYSPHMVKFSNPEIYIEGRDGDVSFPQIILMNRHDGLGSFKFMAGLYRLVCSNGLVIATQQFASYSIPHKGYSFEELRHMVQERTKALPEQLEVMNKMKQIDLNPGQRRKLAMEGILLRSGIDPTTVVQDKVYNIDPQMIQDVLTPARPSDEGNDLWATYNVIQEKLIKGGFNVGTRRTAKAVKSFEKDLSLNSQLFKSALALLPA
jgi:hypothetical protein